MGPAGTWAVVGIEALLGIQGPRMGTVEWVGRDSSAQNGAWRRRDTFPQMLHTRFAQGKRGQRRPSVQRVKKVRGGLVCKGLKRSEEA